MKTSTKLDGPAYFKKANALEITRYIRYYDGTEELYFHDNDENEWTNLAKDESYKAKKRSWQNTFLIKAP